MRTILSVGSFRCWLVLVVIYSVSGCGVISSMLAERAINEHWYKVYPAAPSENPVSATHYVTIDFEGQQLSSINQLEWSSDGFFLGAYSHFGGAMFSLAYQNNELRSKISPAIPAYFNAELVLRDYHLSLLPLEALEPGLVDDSVEIIQSGMKRVFRREGQDLVSIAYSANTPWVGNLKLVNHESGYTLTFEALP